MREIPEMFKDDEIAKTVKLAEDASNLCCDLAFDTGAMLDFSKESEDSEKLFDMLGYAIDTLSSLVNEIGQLYCMAPYYRSKGMSEAEVEGFRQERLDGVKECEKDMGDLQTYHTLLKANHPVLRDPDSQYFLYMPGEDGENQKTSL